MNLLKRLILTLIALTTLLACEPQNEVDGNSDGYVDDRLQGNWQSFDVTYTYNQIATISVNGSEILWCNPANPYDDVEAEYDETSGTIGKDSITYLFDNKEFSTSYKLEGDTLKIGDGNQEYNFIKDSDFNPCDGNINNSSFQFKIIYDDGVYTSPSGDEVYGSPSADYEFKVNGIKLFDETRTIDEGRGCSYTITPDINYEIDIEFTYKYCIGYECAFTNNWGYKTVRKTLKLTQLQNTVCNELIINQTPQGEYESPRTSFYENSMRAIERYKEYGY